MKKVLSVYSLLTGLVCFVAFMVLSCGAHYMTTGLFPDAEPALAYAILGAVGGLTMIFRRYRFAVIFYLGTALGWMTGHFISGLEGFAPTAALIATWFLIGVFTLLGVLAEVSHLKRGYQKKLARREAEQKAEAERQAALRKAQEEKVKAAEAQADPEPVEPEAPIQ